SARPTGLGGAADPVPGAGRPRAPGAGAPSGNAAPLAVVAPLLLCSGACALAYQTAWTREFRLIFGASTAASAAVVAVFMGGLGLGGRLIGPRADRRADPLAFYARLEGPVAPTAAPAPWLLALMRPAHTSPRGTATL